VRSRSHRRTVNSAQMQVPVLIYVTVCVTFEGSRQELPIEVIAERAGMVFVVSGGFTEGPTSTVETALCSPLVR
jgi:hypothetical protein